jgi:hypothetical protein
VAIGCVPLLQQRQEQGLLGREVPIDRTLGEAGFRCDVVQGRRLVAKINERVLRGVEQALARVLRDLRPPAACGARRWRSGVHAAA